ncbi:hypothetical protein DCAR_0314010 [Daucus carota subsp. sativus]|uniref:Uncharacterized protein n=1 Tax=Daucus carota subsp. sativus TaxID=79200 RepID=A0A166CD49_DAUCS|nr:PREDICTED: myb-related protein Zm38-like [Daucus carota subsp. sativus]WOG94713.1 hypothetical protein DCAR_0314010 [Daucus carota subsp. sativus]
MGRTPCCEKVGLKRGRWTAREDEILTAYIRANGEGSWRSLPKKAGLLRCGKSCRLRWINYLRPDVKRGQFSSDEEDVIIKLHAALGNKWSLIAGHLDGRTDNEIKNYWNSHLSRKAKSLPVFHQIKPVETRVLMEQLQKQGKKGRSKAPKIPPSEKNLLEIPEDCSLKVQIEPPTPFMEESLGDILKWTPDNISNECTRLPDQQGLWNDIDLGKDIAGGTFLDSGFGMDFLGDLDFNGSLETALATATGNELVQANHNQETNTPSVTNSASCIHKESVENPGWDYLDSAMQGDNLFWDTEQERLLISGLWEATDEY